MEAAAKKQPEQNTDLLLGQLIGKMDGVETQLKTYGGQIKGLTDKVDRLPCTRHQDEIDFLKSCRAEDKKNERDQGQNKRKWVRDLVLVMLAGIITGIFTLLGVWLTLGHQEKPLNVAGEELVPMRLLLTKAQCEETTPALRIASSPLWS